MCGELIAILVHLGSTFLVEYWIFHHISFRDIVATSCDCWIYYDLLDLTTCLQDSIDTLVYISMKKNWIYMILSSLYIMLGVSTYLAQKKRARVFQIDGYVHRIGRCGRAGRRGTAVTFVARSFCQSCSG